jgi:hypothetical protein
VIGPLTVARAGVPVCVSWTGCPAQTSCIHHLEERHRRVTALCRACSEAYPRVLAMRETDRAKPTTPATAGSTPRE